MELLSQVAAYVLTALVCFLSLPFMGRVMDGRIYPRLIFEKPFLRLYSAKELDDKKKPVPKGATLADPVAYTAMALSMWPHIGLLWALALIPAFALMFSPGHGKRTPWSTKRDWFPDEVGEPPATVMLTLFMRYTWGSCLVAVVYWFAVAPMAGYLISPACGVTVALGYLLGANIMDKGDGEGKYSVGAVLAVLFLSVFALFTMGAF